MSTRIERLSPEITTLAASIGQEVRYYGGDYFMVPCQRSLWNTRELGKLTKAGAEEVRQALVRFVDKALPEQARPVPERIAAVAERLREAGWRPGHFTEITTGALDRGFVSRWLGNWEVEIKIIGGPSVRGKDHPGTLEEAIKAVQEQAVAAAGPPC